MPDRKSTRFDKKSDHNDLLREYKLLRFVAEPPLNQRVPLFLINRQLEKPILIELGIMASLAPERDQHTLLRVRGVVFWMTDDRRAIFLHQNCRANAIFLSAVENLDFGLMQIGFAADRTPQDIAIKGQHPSPYEKIT
jgi:hypothetical protein